MTVLRTLGLAVGWGVALLWAARTVGMGARNVAAAGPTHDAAGDAAWTAECGCAGS